MAALQLANSRVDLDRFVASLCRSVALAISLTACSAEPQGGRVSLAQAPPSEAITEECSVVGVMACKAAALVSGDAAGTCIALRSTGGTRVEKCSTSETKPPPVGIDINKPAPPSVQLSWADNSKNEESFVIERCDQVTIQSVDARRIASCAGAWTIVGRVAANVTTYVDKSVSPNRSYLYRVKAMNSSGSSGYTNEMLYTAPAK
jgi:hypothetical protein